MLVPRSYAHIDREMRPGNLSFVRRIDLDRGHDSGGCMPLKFGKIIPLGIWHATD
jgi:hypothetical protein